MGFLGPRNEERISRIQDFSVVKRLLENIKALLDDAQELREKDGVIKQSGETAVIGIDGKADRGIESALDLERIGGVGFVSRHSRFWPKFKDLSRSYQQKLYFLVLSM